MLELAAKAAGQERSAAGDLWSNARGQLWDPLGDDGDALRLAVRLGITMYPAEGVHDSATAAWADPSSEWVVADRTDDPFADMRRAITRAAAEIGKQMGGSDV